MPGGIDLVIKAYFDNYRQRNELPPELQGKIEGRLFDNMPLLKRWRSWRATDLFYEDKTVNAVLSGALDDCLVDNNMFIPLDYKTRGSELTDDPRKYYQTQLDCYCLLLQACGYKTKGIAYLLYYWPLEAREEGVIKFKVEPIKIETNIEAGKKVFRDAAVLLGQEMPKARLECEYCNLVASRKNEA